ncbi:MAG: tetratricopeptide repeat protein [Deltaproteobacteria bacterium]|nr:tetratricopeptide repeat protein [Deltaproteobacteria bacterium]
MTAPGESMPPVETAAEQGPEPEPVGLAELLRQAEELATGDHIEQAETLLRDLLAQISPVHFALGRLLLGKGELGAAIALLGVAALLHPESLDAVLALAGALARAGRSIEAIRVLETARGHHAGSAALLRVLGTSLLAAGRPQHALAYLEQAATLGPGHAGTHLRLGVALARLGRCCAARECFRKAVALSPGDAEAWNNLAAACHDQGLHEEGRRASEQALALAPDSMAARSNFLFYSNTDPLLTPGEIFERHRSWGRHVISVTRSASDSCPRAGPGGARV